MNDSLDSHRSFDLDDRHVRLRVIYHQKLDASMREAQFKAAQTSQMYDTAWNELRAEVQTLHAQAIDHDRIVNVLDADIVSRAKQTLDLSIDAYRVDRITFQQLIDNYKTLLRYRLDYYRRLSQREQALATAQDQEATAR